MFLIFPKFNLQISKGIHGNVPPQQMGLRPQGGPPTAVFARQPRPHQPNNQVAMTITQQPPQQQAERFDFFKTFIL